eukprot:scaffold170_cov281-Pinguiococcus_pyrenoidosus.AAC.4
MRDPGDAQHQRHERRQALRVQADAPAILLPEVLHGLRERLQADCMAEDERANTFLDQGAAEVRQLRRHQAQNASMDEALGQQFAAKLSQPLQMLAGHEKLLGLRHHRVQLGRAELQRAHRLIELEVREAEDPIRRQRAAPVTHQLRHIPPR